MSSFSIDIKQSKKVVKDEEALIKKLAAIEISISSVKNGLSLGASTWAVSRQIAQIAANVNDERSKMKDLKRGLEAVNSLYISTENKLLGADDKKASVSSILSGIIGTVMAPQIAVSSVMANLLGIGTGKNNFLTDWVQNTIDYSNNPFLDLFGFKAEDENSIGISSDGVIDQLSDSNLSDTNPLKKAADKLKAINDAGELPGIQGYVDENGKYHPKKDSDDNSDESFSGLNQEATLASIGTNVSGALWDETNESGTCGVAAGKVDANAMAYAGLFSYTDDGKKKFTPGIGAEVGMGITAFTAFAGGALGNEYFDVHGDVSVDVGKVGASAAVNVGLYDSEGKLNPQAGVRLEAEALVAEASATGGVKVAGTDIDVTGSVNFGIGAHADVGIRDGKISIDIGASLGVGVGVKLDIDFSGTVNAAADMASDAWSGIVGWFTG